MTRQTLFGEEEADKRRMPVAEVAALLNVSTASINNWVRTGYLRKAGKNHITKDSFRDFREHVAGSEKLHKRANKQHAPLHNHDKLSSDIADGIWRNLNDRDYGDKLAKLYESSLSNAYKNKEGVYYTPLAICNDLMGKLSVKNTTQFCDPCCGSGNFLIAAIKAGIDPENITGFDIDPIAVEIARRRIFDRTGCVPKNIHTLDFLSAPGDRKYDVIVTNPPWGKKYPKGQKQAIADKLGLNASANSSSFFTLAALQVIRTKGGIGMLLPEAFFNVRSYQKARRIVLGHRIDFLIDYGKVFGGLVTKAQAILLTKTSPHRRKRITCLSKGAINLHKQRSFLNTPFSVMNFTLTESEGRTIEYMLGKTHTSLKGNAKWGLGIVTGNNGKFLKNFPGEGLAPVYKGSDLGKGVIAEPSSYIPDDLSKYQQVASPEMYNAPRKIIYRFISSDLVFCLDDSQRLTLNSANMIVIDEVRLAATQKIVDYFNLEIINWFHKKLFDTHKILRSNLESIPVYTNYLNNVDKPCQQSLLQYLGLEEVNGTYRVKKQNL